MTGTALLCALVVGLAIAYAVEEARRLASGRLFRLVTRGQAIRRVVGALLVAVMVALVYAGLDLIDPLARPVSFLVAWLAVSVLLLLVVGFCWLDVRELRANRDLEITREALRMNSRPVSGECEGTEPPGAGE